MILGGPGSDGVPGRDDVAEVMSRPEFQYPRSIPERVGDWIGERLDDLFGRASQVDAPGVAAPGAGIGSLVGWVMVLIAVAVIVVVVVLVIRHWVPRAERDDASLTDVETEHRRSAAAWRSEAERFEAEGEWKPAIKARFRELVRTLVDRSQVADLAGRTTTELARDLESTTPGAGDAFATACILFELPWYAGSATGQQENARFRAAAAEVLDAPVVAPLDRDPVVVPGRVGVHR